MLVNKPQFDNQQLAPGNAILVTAYKWEAVNNSYAWPALVVEFTPLKIVVARFNPEKDEYRLGHKLLEEVTINVEDVASNYLKIEKLTVAKGEN